MKRLFAITVVMLLSSAMFFVVVCAAGPTIPTKGRWGGTTTFIIPTPAACGAAGGVAVSAEGKGVASPWGASTWVGDPTCLFPLIPVPPTDYISYGGKQVFQGFGTATITAANGGEIYLEMVFTFIGNPLAETQGQWTQDVDINGGTGSAMNAVGHAFSSGVWTNEGGGNLSWEGTHTGTIEY